MIVCVLSDSHDNIPLLNQAIQQAKAQGAEVVLHCGDVVAPSTIGTTIKHGLAIHVIHGNNVGDPFIMGNISALEENKINYHGQDAGLTIAGKKIFLVHYPHYAKAMCTTGDWDIVCCGHSHNVSIEKIKNIRQSETLLVNPGTVGGVANKPATYVLLDLEKTGIGYQVHEIDVS
jgi:uncharacterized protein